MLYQRLKNISILFFCLVRYIFKGRSNKKKKNINTFLVVPTGKMGDMVCNTPVLNNIRKVKPQAKIVVVGSILNKEILNHSNLFDDYIQTDGFLQTILRIRRQRADFACITGPNFRGLAFLFLSGIPLIIAPEVKGGYCPTITFPYRILSKLVVLKFYFFGKYAPQEQLKLLEPAGIFTKDTEKVLGFSEEAKQKINIFFKNKDIIFGQDFLVGISPSAGNKIKKWSERKFAKLADYLYKNYKAKVIVVGGRNDVEEVNKMLSFLDKGTKVINILNQFNVDELKALISKLNLFISVDTGPIYIAEAFKVPTIDIVGPMDEREQPPASKIHKIVKLDNGMSPQLHVMNARVYNKEEARRQIDNITVEMVIEKIKEIILIIFNDQKANKRVNL